MEHRRTLMREFLADLHSAKSSEDLMKKYGLTAKALDQVCRKLNTRELTILRGLWFREELSDSQFMRAFSEPEDLLRDKNA